MNVQSTWSWSEKSLSHECMPSALATCLMTYEKYAIYNRHFDPHGVILKRLTFLCL